MNPKTVQKALRAMLNVYEGIVNRYGELFSRLSFEQIQHNGGIEYLIRATIGEVVPEKALDTYPLLRTFEAGKKTDPKNRIVIPFGVREEMEEYGNGVAICYPDQDIHIFPRSVLDNQEDALRAKFNLPKYTASEGRRFDSQGRVTLNEMFIQPRTPVTITANGTPYVEVKKTDQNKP